MRRGALAGGAAVLALCSALAMLLLLTDNPTIDNTSRGDDYGCAAPWDTVWNDAPNTPGGDPVPDGVDIAHRCRAVGEARYDQAKVAGFTSASLGAVAVGLALTRRRPQPAELRS